MIKTELSHPWTGSSPSHSPSQFRASPCIQTRSGASRFSPPLVLLPSSRLLGSLSPLCAPSPSRCVMDFLPSVLFLCASPHHVIPSTWNSHPADSARVTSINTTSESPRGLSNPQPHLLLRVPVALCSQAQKGSRHIVPLLFLCSEYLGQSFSPLSLYPEPLKLFGKC